jgi:hypothetical protein
MKCRASVLGFQIPLFHSGTNRKVVQREIGIGLSRDLFEAFILALKSFQKWNAIHFL